MSCVNIVVFLVRVLLFILNLQPQRQLQQSEANVKSAFSFSCLLFFFQHPAQVERNYSPAQEVE